MARKQQSPITPQTWSIFGLPTPDAEVAFHSRRRWRLDFVWFSHRLAVEVDGGAFVGGRHVSGFGSILDNEKINHAVLAGYRVLRFSPRQVRSGYAAAVVRALMAGESEPALPDMPEAKKSMRRTKWRRTAKSNSPTQSASSVTSATICGKAGTTLTRTVPGSPASSIRTGQETVQATLKRKSPASITGKDSPSITVTASDAQLCTDGVGAGVGCGKKFVVTAYGPWYANGKWRA